MGFETEMRGEPEKYKKEVNDLIIREKLLASLYYQKSMMY
jgi:hypothetical protein